MKLQDALFNWLQIKLVAEARPEDHAARETLEFFAEILRDDHRLANVEVAARDASFITVSYEADGNAKSERFPAETAEKLLHDINGNPKYNE